MDKLAIYQVDAFASELFRGNPAAVCPLQQWLSDDIMQAIAAENNLSETVFFVPEGEEFHIRWFTPELEVNLCGHATLAASHVLYEHLGYERASIKFHSRSGPLSVSRAGDMYQLNFPARPSERLASVDEIQKILGVKVQEVWKAEDMMVVLDNENAVRDFQPDHEKLGKIDARGVIVTAPGRNSDMVSRFFAPAVGVLEDPVTGSAHCILVPYWAERLGKSSLHAFQLSRRGGELFCELHGDRVHISGKAVTYLEGYITLG